MHAPSSPAPRSSSRLVWATDVHLNFIDGAELTRFCASLAEPGSSAVVLTGDIAEAPSLRRLLERVAAALEQPIYFVLGNHDFYHGSIAEVRALAAEISAQSRWLRWLPATGIVPLGPDCALVGHDGWADGRLGNYARSPVMLNDFVMIEELSSLDPATRLQRLQRLGDEAAAYVKSVLLPALAHHRTVVVATHIPPFKEACWHEGQISNDDWLPFFTCKAVGDVLLEAARAHPDRRIEVLCGHTHGGGVAQLAPNLVVRTGAADYGSPAIAGIFDTGLTGLLSA
ncbi:MAG: metallophosphoesterase [Minicystis sp.]